MHHRVNGTMKNVLQLLKPKLRETITTDLEYIRDNGLTGIAEIKLDLLCLVDSAKDYRIDVTEIIKKVFHNKYVKDILPLAWRYNVGKTSRYLAFFFKEHNVTTDVKLKIFGNEIKVSLQVCRPQKYARTY